MSSVSTKTLKPVKLRFEVWDKYDDSRLDDMFSLWTKCHPTAKVSLDNFRQLVKVGHGFFLAYLNDKPIGYVWFNYSDRSRGRKVIQTIEYFITPRQRGNDFPQKLIEGITAFARRRGISLVHLVHNNDRMIEHITQVKRRRDLNRVKNPGLVPATSMRIGTKKIGPYRDAFIRIKLKR